MSKGAAKPGKKQKTEKSSGTNPNRNTYLALAAIVIITFIAYSNVFTFNFSNLDDTANILANKQITAINAQHLQQMFSKTYVQMYVPLTMLSYATDYLFAGALNPAYFHFFNLFYHLVNIVLAFVFIKKLSGNNITALVVATLFALHPMNVETVSWISTRSTLLYAALGLLSMTFYIHYLQAGNSFKYLAVSVLFFALSLLAKPALILLPLLLLGIDYYKDRKFSLQLLFDKVPFGILSAIFLGITLYARSTDVQTHKETFSIISRLFFATYGLSFYTAKLFAPVHLCVVNPFPDSAKALPVIFYLSALIIPLFGLAVYKAGKLKKEVAFGIAFFIVNLVLVLQLLPYGYSVVSERYVYLPYLGLFLIIGQLVNGIYNNKYEFADKIKPYLLPALVAITAVFTIATYNRSEVWENPLTLFQDAEAKQPDSYYVQYCSGVAHVLFNDKTAAMANYNKSIELKPGYGEAYSARGSLYDALNDSKNALADYNKALALAPYLTDTYYNRGNNRLIAGDFNAAINDYNTVIKSDSTYDNALCNRGTAWFNLNNLANACPDWAKAAALGNQNAITLLGQHCK